MPAIMPDNDIAGQFHRLLRICTSDEWSEMWRSLAVGVHTFEDLKISRSASDREVWQTCQQHDVVLVTGNRNEDGSESLEATIRELNGPSSLPVLTIADLDRILRDASYAERVAIQLMEYLVNLERVRGTGRLYLP